MSERALSSDPGQFVATRLQAGIAWITLALVLVSALALGANRPAAWVLLVLAVVLLFAGQLILDLMTSLDLPASRVAGPALLYLSALGWALLQIWPGLFPQWADPAWQLVPEALPRISSDPVAGAHSLMRLALYGMIFWIIVRAATHAKRAKAMLVTIAFFSTGLAAFGLFAALIGWNPVLGEDATGRVSATFVNRNSYATYAIFGLLANLGLYLSRIPTAPDDEVPASIWLRDFLEAFFSGGWVFAVGFFLCLAATLLTESRAGVAAAVVGLSVFALAKFRSRRVRNPWTAGSVLVFLVAAGAFLSSDVGTRLSSTGSDEARFEIYGALIDGIAERPWTGHGIGAFEDSFRRLVPPGQAAQDWDYAHSSYLENGYEFGVIGAAVFYGALLWTAVVILRGVLTRRRNRVFSCVALGCLAAAAFHALFDFSLQMPATASLFAVILALGWAQSFGHATGAWRLKPVRPAPSDHDDVVEI